VSETHLPDVGTRRILANTVYRGAADVGSKLISIAFFVVLARQLGESAFGVFVFGLTLAAMLTVLAGFGQDQVLTREVARDRSRLDEYFANTAVLKLALALPVLVAAALVMAAAGVDAETLWVVLLLGIALVAEQLASTCFAVYQAFEQLVYVPVVIITQRLITALAGIAAVLAGASVVAVSVVYLGGAVAAMVLAYVLLVRRVARPGLLVRTGSWRRLLIAAAPVGVASVLSLLMFRVDTAILAFLESDAVVGAYGAAFRLFEATLFLSWAVTTAVFPVLARLSITSRPSVGEVFDGSLKLVVALTLPLGVGMAILSEPIVHLVFGQAFDEAVVPLQLLSPAIVAYSIAFVSGGMLVAQNRQRATAIVYGAMTAFNIAASLILIPARSLDGAALAALFTQIFLASALLAIARATAGSIGWTRIFAGPLAASAALALTTFFLRDSLLAAILVGGLVYLVGLAAFERVAYPEDARRIWAFLRQSREPAAAPR
jgi:O-antigen/teichoic acid export membrane protein